YRPTLFFGVPTLYAGMLAVKDAEARFDTSSLRLCVSAGEALPDEIYKRWRERFGVEIIDGIGTTEICHVFISNRPGRARPGRSDDMLKVGGIWVSPVEVEATLVRHPVVLEAAVVGKEDTDRLVKPKAFVVLKEPGKASEELANELKAFVKDKIAPYKYPRWIEFVGELPKTATGKI